MKKYLAEIILILFLLLPTFSLALELDYPSFMGIDLNELAATREGVPINQLVAWFYYFLVGISGLSTFLMLVWGGFTWLTSTGNPTKISDAKDKITSAVLGLVIILSSYLILKVINPELTTLKLPGLP
jgi:hypothetical protein